MVFWSLRDLTISAALCQMAYDNCFAGQVLLSGCMVALLAALWPFFQACYTRGTFGERCCRDQGWIMLITLMSQCLTEGSFVSIVDDLWGNICCFGLTWFYLVKCVFPLGGFWAWLCLVLAVGFCFCGSLAFVGWGRLVFERNIKHILTVVGPEQC